jgi:hypothetical protein
MTCIAREHLAAAALARPFRPFTVRLGEQDTIRVSHPEVVYFPPKNPQAAVVSKPGGGVRVIFFSSITAIEAEPMPTTIAQ